MRLIRWIITVPLGLVVVVFAVSNLDPVDVRLEPFAFSRAIPFYLIVLIVALVAFLTGGFVAWVSGRKWRSRARREAHRAEELTRENADLRHRAQAPTDRREVMAPRPPGG